MDKLQAVRDFGSLKDAVQVGAHGGETEPELLRNLFISFRPHDETHDALLLGSEFKLTHHSLPREAIERLGKGIVG